MEHHIKNSYIVLSIVIPVLNEEKHIRNCLSSLTQVIGMRDDIEIILVDNGSKDKTLEFAKKFDKVKIFQVPNVNISALRNTGANYANGNILAFLDADCVVRNDWLINCIKCFDHKNISILGADPMIPSDSSWVAKAWSTMYINSPGAREVKWVASHNLMVRKEIYHEIEGFREDLTVSEDVDFCQRAREHNYRIVSDSKMAVIHLKTPETIKEFFNKELWRGNCAMALFIGNLPQIKGIKPLVLGLLIIFSILSIPFIIALVFYNKRTILLSIPLLSILTGPFFLATKSSIRQNNFYYFFSLILLFLVYGTARGIAAINPKNWRFSQVKERRSERSIGVAK